MANLTAEILVLCNKTDPWAQRILVEETEWGIQYVHPQFSKMFDLPEAWREKAEAALARKRQEIQRATLSMVAEDC